MTTFEERPHAQPTGPEHVAPAPPVVPPGPEAWHGPGAQAPDAPHPPPTLPLEVFSYQGDRVPPPRQGRRLGTGGRLAVLGLGLATAVGGAVVFSNSGGNEGEFGQVSVGAPPRPDDDPSTTVTTAEPEPVFPSLEVLNLDGPISYRAIEARGTDTAFTLNATNGEVFYVPGIMLDDPPETATSSLLNGVSAYLVTGDQFALDTMLGSGAYTGDTRKDTIISDLDRLFDTVMVAPAQEDLANGVPEGDLERRQVLFGTGDLQPGFDVQYDTFDVGSRTVTLRSDLGKLFVRVVRDPDLNGHGWQEAPDDPDAVERAYRVSSMSFTTVPVGDMSEIVVDLQFVLEDEVTGERVFSTNDLDSPPPGN